MDEEEYNVVDTMAKYGGGFVKSLAECFYHADIDNIRKLKNAFPEYWKEYELLSKEETK